MHHNRFKKASWINRTNVYEVNLRQYSEAGTINAFLPHLPRLKSMGIDTLWFMPLTPIAVKNRKGSLGSQYACSDYIAISEEYGTVEDFKNFVEEAHQQGFKVIVDWVANHTGWDHVWTITHPTYYKIDPQTNDFKIASGMDDIIELNYDNPELRSAMIEAMRYWITTFDIDGFRCDLAFWVVLDFWVEARAALESTKTLFWLAENDGIENAHYYEAFDACYTWTWMHKTAEFYKHHWQVDALREILHQYNQAGEEQDLKLWFTANHDENSWNGTEYEKYGDAAKAFAVFSCTWNGIPLIYSGQELPNIKRLAFFEKDVIEWNGNYALHDFYQKLLNLKTSHPALAAGDTTVKIYLLNTDTNHQVLAYLRECGSAAVLVLLNMSNDAASFKIYDEQAKGIFTNLFEENLVQLDAKHWSLAPWQYVVLYR